MAVVGFVDDAKMAVSSAYVARRVLSVLGMSDVYIAYKWGERAEPCGTPAVRNLGEEEEFCILTEKVLRCKYDWIMLMRWIGYFLE